MKRAMDMIQPGAEFEEMREGVYMINITFVEDDD